MTETPENLTSTCRSLVVYFLHLKYDHHYDTFLLSLVVLNFFIAFTTVCSNLLVIWTISRTRSLHSPSYFFIFGLSISDLCVGAFVQTTFCVYKLFQLQRKVTQFCNSGLVYISSSSIVGVVSFLLLIAITADRFLAVHFHLRYKELVTNKRYGLVMVFIWLSSIIVGISRVLAINQTTTIIMLVLFAGLLVLSAYLHVQISLVIRRHSRQINVQQRVVQHSIDIPKFAKSVNATYYMIGAFVACYTPQICALAAHFLLNGEHTLQSRFVFTLTETLWMSNGVLNPIIYVWRIQAIRQAVRQCLRGIRCKNQNTTHQSNN